jgi:hypothetical protein
MVVKKNRLGRAGSSKKRGKTTTRTKQAPPINDAQYVAALITVAIDDSVKMLADRILGSSLLSAAVTGLLISNAEYVAAPDELATQADAIVNAVIDRVHETVRAKRNSPVVGDVTNASIEEVRTDATDATDASDRG